MDDKFILLVAHWIEHLLVAGGCSGAILTWWLSKKKKPHLQFALSKEFEEHKAEDGKKFDGINGHLEKQYDLMVSVSTDLGKIKGKLDIQ